MGRRTITATLIVTMGLLGACDGGDGSDSVAAASLEEAGTAEFDGDVLVVQLAQGPVRLDPAADTQFFICDGDDCESVDEAAFRAAVTPGDQIRVLGPNAELLAPDAEALPAALWVVLDRGEG